MRRLWILSTWLAICLYAPPVATATQNFNDKAMEVAASNTTWVPDVFVCDKLCQDKLRFKPLGAPTSWGDQLGELLRLGIIALKAEAKK